MTIRKENIVAMLVDKGFFTRHKSERVVTEIINYLINSLMDGDDVVIQNLIQIHVKEMKGYTLDSSALTGRTYNIPSRKRATAKVAKEINRVLREE